MTKKRVAVGGASSVRAAYELERLRRAKILDELFSAVTEVLSNDVGLEFESAMLAVEGAVAEARAAMAAIGKPTTTAAAGGAR